MAAENLEQKCSASWHFIVTCEHRCLHSCAIQIWKQKDAVGSLYVNTLAQQKPIPELLATLRRKASRQLCMWQQFHHKSSSRCSFIFTWHCSVSVVNQACMRSSIPAHVAVYSLAVLHCPSKGRNPTPVITGWLSESALVLSLKNYAQTYPGRYDSSS